MNNNHNTPVTIERRFGAEYPWVAYSIQTGQALVTLCGSKRSGEKWLVEHGYEVVG
jgi:hypothetical protein